MYTRRLSGKNPKLKPQFVKVLSEAKVPKKAKDLNEAKALKRQNSSMGQTNLMVRKTMIKRKENP